MRLMMMSRERGAELLLRRDDDTTVRVADLLEAGMDSPIHLRPGALPSLLDLFRSGDVPAALAWLEQSAGDAEPMDLNGWTWEVPDTGGSLFCVGRNYAAHAAELGNVIPGQPLFFMKPRGCLAAHEQTVSLPEGSDNVHYEGELALVIGRPLHGRISDQVAREAVVAVTLLNDVTDRGEQNRAKEQGKPWFRAKGRFGFAPMGSCLRTVDSTEPLADFRYETLLNGKLVQQGDPSLWLWRAEAVIRDLSETCGLEAGDIIATGTPSGVGRVRPGDTVELRSARIGELRTVFR